jgi:hypothetical protein
MADEIRARLNVGRVHLARSSNRRYAVTLMKSGLNKNRWIMPAPVLAAALPLFDNAACLVDHAGWFDTPSLRNLAGNHQTPVFTDERLTAELVLNDTDSGNLLLKIFDAWLDDKDAGRTVTDVGLSADLSVKWRKLKNVDDPYECAEITKVWSVDAVLHPAAGGQVERVLNSLGATPTISPGGKRTMPDQEVPTNPGGEDTPAVIDAPQPPPEPSMSEERSAVVMSAIAALQEQVEGILPQPEPEPDPVTLQLNALTDTVAQLALHVADPNHHA